MIGKSIRIERIFNRQTGRAVIVPMDHGVTVGPIRGIADIRSTADKVASAGADAAVVHKGAAAFGHRGYGPDLGLILHLSASTALGPDPNNKVLVATVEEALKLGADGVSIQVNVGAKDEGHMLSTLGAVSRSCQEWGMPLLAMMYPRGRKIKDEYAEEYVAHAARVGAELGADVIKTSYTGSYDSFVRVVEGCPAPVVIAGGPRCESDQELLQMVRDAVDAGGSGVAIGRNIFQHEDPGLMTRRICAVVHQDLTAAEAMQISQGGS
ncbi:MAG: 2-amino-3,7-dideoxy-D-threo-hept-6-ulosonate synthase [Methanosaeta sp. PtaB.Bin039]|nr:MAG: 2-amino-3,7-dideoxy-D-threo-hept-6-ulosonate synthase [Methanosaeta sp. PtaB.Bin039]OPY44833.1 MAG: 2-amino-3,7-dideoxy-D-threo-hept-6-ulosonate synthase [Methanosaeta sp. PtaU1.Bin028]